MAQPYSCHSQRSAERTPNNLVQCLGPRTVVVSERDMKTAILLSALVALTLIVTMVFLQVTHFPTRASSGSGPPILIGWGGTRIVEVARFEPGNPPSDAFLGETASDQEVQMRTLAHMGFNTIRVSFAPLCSLGSTFMGVYNETQVGRSIRLAEHYHLWMILDYHGANDTTTSARTNCWLGAWKTILLSFKDSYDQLLWEPLNEPNGLIENVTQLSAAYQSWIDQARSLDDNHWIVIQNLCSYGCTLRNLADGFPRVTDPIRRVFISIHPYFWHPSNFASWTNSTAEQKAQRFYNATVQGSKVTGWPVLVTEGGAFPGCTSCAPDAVLTGAAGYTKVSFHFIQTLTNLFDTNSPRRINWVYWPMGDWTTTTGAGVLGALAPNGWGSNLHYITIQT